jgi:hypothetical protein
MRRFSGYLTSLCVALLAVTMAIHSPAQTAQTSLRGTVHDPNAALIPGAIVTIKNADTGFTTSRTADEHGAYFLDQLPPGTYSIESTANGFAKERYSLELLVNQPATLDITLAVGGSSTTVEVNAQSLSYNSSDATLGTPFDNTQIQSLPFEGNNVLDLLSLQAGVLFLGDKSTTQQDTDSRSGAVNGARSDQSNYTLDGLDDNTQTKGYAYTGVLRSTRDSVEEFRVVTSNANADSGRSSGAQVSLVTRGGTNHLHGSLYEFYRPTDTVANDWFNKEAELSNNLPNIPPKLLRNTFGGSVGGPVLRDKLFYFMTFEGQRLAESSQISNTVPTDAFRQGNLSYINSTGTLTTLDPAQIASMDPKCSSNGSCPLGPGVNSAVTSYFAHFPSPNINAGGSGDDYNQQVYTFSSPAPQVLNTYIAKVDYDINSRHRVFVRGNLQGDNVAAAEQFPHGIPDSELYSNNKGIAAGEIWTISNNMVNNFRYGYIRQGFANRGATQSNFVNFGSITALTSTNNTSQIVTVPVNNIVDDLSWNKGQHTLQFGMNYRGITNNRTGDNTLYTDANVTANYLTTGSIAGQGGSLDPGAFGLPPVGKSFYGAYNTAISDITGLITQAFGYYNYIVSGDNLDVMPAGQWPARHYISHEFEYYLQDSWKLRRNLTITAGMRHSLLQVPYERNGQEVQPNVNLDTWFAARAAGALTGQTVQPPFSFVSAGKANHQPDLWSRDKLDIAPRLAIAFSPEMNGSGPLSRLLGANGRTTIRAGYGMYYDHFGLALIDAYDEQGAYGLSTNASSGINQTVDTAPRFSAFNSPPTSLLPPPTPGGSFPVTPGQTGDLAWSIDQSVKTPYSHVLDFSIERQLGQGNMLQVSYTGRLGRRLMQMRDLGTPLNLVDPNGGGTFYQAGAQMAKLVDQNTPVSAVPTIQYWEDMFPAAAGGGQTATQNLYQSQFGPNRGNELSALYTLDYGYAPGAPNNDLYRYFDPQWGSIETWSSIGTSSYHGVQVSFHHPSSHNLQYDAYYTFSKSLDEGSDSERAATQGSFIWSQIINVFAPHQNYSPSDFDTRHALIFNLRYGLPFGRGEAVGGNMNRFADAVVGGWTLNALGHWTSGLPWTANDGLGWTTDWNDPSFMIATTPIASGGHQKNPADGQENALKNQAKALTQMRLPYPGETGQRNYFRGDGYASIDSGMSKVFHISENHQIKFSAEIFNLFNQVKFDPRQAENNPFAGGSAFGDYSSPLLTQGRRMQGSLRYSF